MQRHQTLLRRSRQPMVVLALVIMATGCSTQVEIQSATASGDGLQLDISLNSCNRTYDVTVVEADGVTVSVSDARRRSPIQLGGENCADRWTVLLAEPLGDRLLIDGATGNEVEVRYEPWNQQRFSEAEYRSALQATAECIVEVDPRASAHLAESSEGPYLVVVLPELDDGESGINSEYRCTIDHLDPLRS